MAKHNINLLQAELLPEKVLLTFSRVIAVWSVSLLLMVIWSGISYLQNQELSKKHKQVQQEHNKQAALVKELESKITNRRVDSRLTAKLDTLKLVMKHKQALHGKLTDPNRTFVTGFAAAMEELAQMHHQDIRLQVININHDDMSFAGLAKSPEAVPAWLAGFENSTLLSGKSFVHFKLSKNEENLTEFVVSSKPAKEVENDE